MQHVKKEVLAYWGELISKLFFSALRVNITNCLFHHGPGQECSTVADPNHQNITGTIYRAAVTSGKWDVCTEHKDTNDNTRPDTVCSPCCHLTTDADTYVSVVRCCSSRLHSSFTPQTVRLLNSSTTLHFLWKSIFESVHRACAVIVVLV